MSDITQQITEYCLKLLLNQFGRALDAAPDYLTHLADQTSFDNERTIYLDSMHELRFTRKKVYQAIVQEIEKPFELLLKGTVPVEYERQGGLVRNVTGATELEEKLALETMLNKAQMKADIPLQNIARSLDAMMGNDWVKNHYNPLDPEFIIRAWVAGIHEMQLHSKGLLGLYALLDSEVLGKLSRIYEKISQYIQSLGVQSASPISDGSQAPEQTSSGDDFEAMFGDIDSISPQSSGQFSAAEIDAVTATTGLMVDTDDIIRKLTELQSNRALDDSNYYNPNYLLDLRELLQGEGLLDDGLISAQTIGEVNNDILDMTKLMFGFIMDNYNIPDDVRYYISRLQIPYLKLGLLDRSLFQNKQHPGRMLLMALSQSINNWDPGHKAGIDQLLTEIMRIVDEVLNEFDKNTVLFDTLHRQFKAFIEGDSHFDESLKERQKQRETRTNKAENARLVIEGSLADICAGKRIPPIVEKILTEYWSKAMFIEFLKEGEQSDAYQELLKTADILVASVQSKASESDRKEMAKTLPQVVKRLKQGLNLISIASFESVDLLRELQHCHMEVLKERPETHPDEEFEVSEEAYESFKAEVNKSEEAWDRQSIEASMLEENIERSITMSSTDPRFEDDNPNVIRQGKTTPVGQTPTTPAEREAGIIDSELQEARDAYEKALREHQQSKTSKSEDETVDDDDFMSMFFQDSNFAEQQKGTAPAESAQQSEQSSPSSADMEQFANEVDLSEIDNDSASNNQPLSDRESKFLSQEMQRPSTPESSKTDTATESSPSQVSEPETDIPNPALGRAHGAEVLDNPELADDDVNELLERLKVGLWVDLYHADGQKVRAKIMAIIPSVGKYIFGDRAGKKLTDYNRQGLYDALKTGRVRLSDIDTAYDKTLESVISNLRIMKKAEDE